MEFLHTDREIAVILKPVGMDSEQEIPAAIAAAIGGEVFPVHRLDKNVGGCMVYARTRRAAAALSRAVQDGTMKKEYVALVHGAVPESGDWEDLLATLPWCASCCTPAAATRSVSSSHPGASPCWATTNMARGMNSPRPCSIPAPSPSR